VPCSKPVRGKTDLKLPWSDVINNDPCGKPVCTMVFTNVDVSAHALCMPHLALKLGQKAVGPPYTFI
jgi:hypothetical protein